MRRPTLLQGATAAQFALWTAAWVSNGKLSSTKLSGGVPVLVDWCGQIHVRGDPDRAFKRTEDMHERHGRTLPYRPARAGRPRGLSFRHGLLLRKAFYRPLDTAKRVVRVECRTASRIIWADRDRVEPHVHRTAGDRGGRGTHRQLRRRRRGVGAPEGVSQPRRAGADRLSLLRPAIRSRGRCGPEPRPLTIVVPVWTSCLFPASSVVMPRSPDRVRGPGHDGGSASEGSGRHRAPRRCRPGMARLLCFQHGANCANSSRSPTGRRWPPAGRTVSSTRNFCVEVGDRIAVLPRTVRFSGGRYLWTRFSSGGPRDSALSGGVSPRYCNGPNKAARRAPEIRLTGRSSAVGRGRRCSRSSPGPRLRQPLVWTTDG